MKKLFLFVLLAAAITGASAQDILLNTDWKLKLGDSTQWASPTYNDAGWEATDVTRSWETQGHPNYDGFGWYRLHIVIPSSIKAKSFLKDSIRINIGVVDDNDELYINGKLVGKYGGKNGDIKISRHGPRTYTIAANDPAILWDQENVFAVRIFDTGGDGGMYGAEHKISVVSLLDNIRINTDADFNYEANNGLSKVIKLTATGTYAYQGKFNFQVIDLESKRIINQKTIAASFTSGSPFTCRINTTSGKKSYQIIYAFADEKSGESKSKTEGIPYILTPVPNDKPRINGANVFGARAGNPFLFLIPATGKKPLVYTSSTLPLGLKLDKVTGIISGAVSRGGDYPITVTVRNALGSQTKKITIKIGDLIGLTPALGWNSWNAFGLSVNDAKVRTAAKSMADKLSAHGWTYINIDDGWEASKRKSNGEITSNEKFPDMKGLADYVHSLGLRMGIYSSPGPATCGGFLGSWQHEDQDAKTYGEWGMDYLKYDWCTYSDVTAKNPTLDDMKKPYQVMRASLDKIPRDILFSFCQYGMGDVWNWGAQVGGNSWRSTGDIRDSWESMTGIGFSQIANGPYSQPGHFNDPDMLVVGKVGGWGDLQHNSGLSPDEQYTHISLWSLLSAPLLIGCDMGQLDKFTLGLLTNDEVIEIDQDALGKSAKQTIRTNSYQVWIKDLEDGSKAVGIFNTSDKYQTISLNKNENGLNAYSRIRDVWRQKFIVNIGSANLQTNVAPHGVMLLKLSK